MRQRLLTVAVLTLPALLSACSGTPTCDRVQAYQKSKQGQPLVVPSDLSVPSSDTRFEVPDTGANDIPPGDCLDMPPRFVAVSEALDLTKEERELRNRNDVIRNTIQAWAQSWAGQNIEFHNSIYDDRRFKPSGGLSREEFFEQRQAEIETTGDDIEIRLQEMTIESTRKEATVRFRQVFNGTNALDPVRREVNLEFRKNAWRIVGETNLPMDDEAPAAAPESALQPEG
ncbi:MAG: hypothetical protein AAGD86_12660 [Pseudomonadota bacterium]